MILYIFSVYDSAVGAFLPPFFSRSKMEAIRSFSAACNEKEHQFSKYGRDYALFELGEFEDSVGSLESIQPTRVISAMECLEDKETVLPFKSTNEAKLAM